jgi:uncharacterized protein YdbL (DUF1318 family)
MTNGLIKTVKYTLTLIATCAVLAVPAYALDLGQAKAQGLVGETPNGYLAAVKPASPAVQQLINSINAQRKARYQEIAKKTGSPLNFVEQQTGKKVIDQTPAGQYVQVGGKWVKK